MKLYLDDIRDAPEGWIRAKTYERTIELLKRRIVTDLSLDNDLGTEKEGYDVLVWIEQMASDPKTIYYVPDDILIHSANVGARPKMELAIQSIKRLRVQNESI